jgi:hypothetical protein
MRAPYILLTILIIMVIELTACSLALNHVRMPTMTACKESMLNSCSKFYHEALEGYLCVNTGNRSERTEDTGSGK